MDKLTDFTDTTDVSDAAIEWVADNLGLDREVGVIRNYAEGGDWDDCAIILAARLIETHRPELLVDPVDAIVREVVAQRYEDGNAVLAAEIRAGEYDHDAEHATVRRAYQMGLEAGKGQDNA